MNTTTFTFTSSVSQVAGLIATGGPAGLEPLLDGVQVCDALMPLLHYRPCIRTLQRWVGNGMPHHLRPSARSFAKRARRWFLLSEVYAWLKGEAVRRDLVQEAVDLGHRRPKHRRIA